VTVQEVEPLGPVAVKWLCAGRKERAHRDALLAESQALAGVAHPNVLRLYGLVLDAASAPVALLTELCPGGSLSARVHAPGAPPLAPRERVSLAVQAARGLAMLHRQPGASRIHFDVKLDNLLLCPGAGDATLKVADLGLSMGRAAAAAAGVDDARGTLAYLVRVGSKRRGLRVGGPLRLSNACALVASTALALTPALDPSLPTPTQSAVDPNSRPLCRRLKCCWRPRPSRRRWTSSRGASACGRWPPGATRTGTCPATPSVRASATTRSRCR